MRVSARVPAVGSIPACTGKPVDDGAAIIGAWVYPRMYGETEYPTVQAAALAGLSPHVRGNQGMGIPHLQRGGSIPACTGKPFSGVTGRDNAGVYPRMYGETLCALP